VYLKGDHALVLDCALADLSVTAGTVRPRMLVLDTSDSTIWVDGTLSLVTETLDLRAVVAPKDFSVLTLRSPLHIQGSFAHPVVVVEKGPLGMKLGLTLLLGLMNPLAGILPLMDVGNTKDADIIAANCRERMQKKTSPALPAGVHKR
jgi:AsmA family protein